MLLSLPNNFIRLLKFHGLLRREHEPSGRPESCLLSECHDTIITTNIYLSFSVETGRLFGSSHVEYSRLYVELFSKLLDITTRLNSIRCYKSPVWKDNST